MELNVLDFEEPEEALAAARDGDVVYFPGGIKEYQPTTDSFRISRSIEVFGDGPADPGDNLSGTTFVPKGSGAGYDVIIIEPTAEGALGRVRMRDFKVHPTGSSDGHIGIWCRTAHGNGIGTLRLDRVNVEAMNDNGFVAEGVDPQPSGGLFEHLLMKNSTSIDCGGIGTVCRNIERAVAIQSGANHCPTDGWLMDRCGVALYQPTTDSNETERSGHLTLTSCRVAIVDAAHFENFGGTHDEACLVQGDVDTRGGPVWVGGCRFIGQYPTPVGAGVRVDDTLEGSVFIAPNHFTRLIEIVNLQVAAGCTVLPQMYLQENTSGVGDVVLVSGARVSASSVNRVAQQPPQGPFYAGLTVPSKSDGDPTWAVQNGMLYYDTTNAHLRVRIANLWKTVVLG